MTATTETAPAATPENKPTIPSPVGSRDHQKMINLINEHRNMSNKEQVEAILNRLTEKERDEINRIARMQVTEYYTLPGQQLDYLHRILRRVITLNRTAFLEAAREEYEKVRAAAIAKQAEEAAKVAAETPPTATDQPVAAEP